MIGIGGIGMAGLAFLLKERGHDVSGCDTQENRQVEWLRAKGIPVVMGHDLSHVAGAEWIIRTTAVPDDHPEVQAASVPVHRRGEALPALLRDRFTLAVGGTHGKTTTTAMIAQILDCGYCIGGEVQGFDGVARDGEVMVVEADESDGTIANYHPDIAVITNVEYDHMERHENTQAFEACFEKFITQTRQNIIYCTDDPVAIRLCKGNPKSIPYGFQRSNSNLQVALPGAHNRLNAMAAIRVARVMGLSDEKIFQGLKQLRSIKRRFEVVVDGDYKVISDYAHHPTEIRALIQTARETLQPKRLLGVFQPHRYTRTQAFIEDFPPAFQGLEKLWLTPVYAASEKPLEGGTTEDLIQKFVSPPDPSSIEGGVEPLRFIPNSEPGTGSVKNCQSLEHAWQAIGGELRAGDVLLMIGAGDIEKMAAWSQEEME